MGSLYQTVEVREQVGCGGNYLTDSIADQCLIGTLEKGTMVN